MPCWYCGVRLKKGGHAMKTRDHVIPKCEGGTRTVDACLKCNQKKRNLSLEEFRKRCGGVEFWAEMHMRLANTETAWIVVDPPIVEKKKVMAQNYERPVYKPTIDLSQISKKERKERREWTAGVCIPCPPPDLLGVKFGAFTVVNRITGKWVVECICGAIEYRSSKAVLNPANTFDACVECRRPVGKLRSDIFKETGVQVSWEDCFKYIYE